MKKYNIYIMVCLGLIWATTGCKKEIDEFIPFPDEVKLAFGATFTDASDTLSYQINGQEYSTITTPGGSTFTFIPELFETIDGNSCVCSAITIKIIELDNKRDYVVHRAQTISNQQLLISAGAYHISAYEGSRPLKIKSGKQLKFFLPDEDPDPEMQLFFGSERNGTFDWTPASATPGSANTIRVGEQQTDSLFNIGYQCFTDRLEWINVDKIASEGPPNPVCVNLEPNYQGENTVVFAILQEQKSVLNLYHDNNGSFCTSNLPIDLKVTFIVVARRTESNYELGVSDALVTEKHQESIIVEPKSLEEIKRVLESL